MNIFLNWSSGKDAAFSFLELLHNGQKPGLLVTTVNEHHRRVSMHGVDRRLLQLQARRMNIPLHEIALPGTVDLATYDKIMLAHAEKLKHQGFDTAAFGDIFLEDLKQYRIRQMDQVGMKCIFPLWGRDTDILAREIIRSGIKAVVVAVDAKRLDKDFAGRTFDEQFLADLPEGVDACGENGEFHTFVYDAPFFDAPVAFRYHGVVFRSYGNCEDEKNSLNQAEPKKWNTGFWFAHLSPVNG